MHRITRLAVLSLIVWVTSSAQGMAASYPSRPVRLVVPAAPAGAADILARGIAPKLAAQLGQQITIDNLYAANGIQGFEAVAKAPADGHTLLLGTMTGLAVNPQLVPKIHYDPVKTFAPISLLARVPMVLIVSPAFKATSVQELIAVAKASPGKIPYGTPGAGSPGHLAGELFKLTAGVDLAHVPYKGAALAVGEVVAGQVPTGFVTLAPALPHVRAGKLRALVVTSVQRSAAAPAVPTTAESGLASVVIAEWFGILAPVATPKAVVSQLSQAINSVLQTPEVQARFSEQAFEPMTRTIDYFENLIQSDLRQMGMIIKRAGIRAADIRH